MGKSKVGKGKNIKERNLEKNESFDPAKLTAKNDHTMSLIRRLAPHVQGCSVYWLILPVGILCSGAFLLVRPPSHSCLVRDYVDLALLSAWWLTFSRTQITTLCIPDIDWQTYYTRRRYISREHSMPFLLPSKCITNYCYIGNFSSPPCSRAKYVHLPHTFLCVFQSAR